MYRYKLLLKGLFGIKSPLENSIQAKLDNLESFGTIDLMSHHFNRYKKVTHFTMPKTIWQSWIRR